MKTRSKESARDQSIRFREAAKKAGGDQKSFEKAFKKVVPTRSPKKKAT